MDKIAIAKIKAEIERLKEWQPIATCSLNRLEIFINSLLEKPVKQSVDEAMADVEEKAKLFTEAHKSESADEILSKMRGEEPVSEELEEAADKYESEQQEKYKDKDNHDFDNYRDGFVDGLTYTYNAFKAGAQWQKERMIEKACERLKEQDEMIGISFKDDFCARFKKAMQDE